MIKKVKSKNVFKKLNNKGNTLSVVLVGIVLLAILSTLILSVTAANFNMKIVQAQSYKNFYYVEKAVDQIYAGIGTEALDSMSQSYQSVLTGMVTKTGASYSSLSNDEANAQLKQSYLDKLKLTYTDNASDIPNIMAHLKDYVKTESNITYTVEAVDTTAVSYDTNSITIKDVCVRSVTNKGYSTSITTDFIITTPNININFSDKSTKDFNTLFGYSLVANGDSTKKTTPSIEVMSNLNPLSGNAYETNITGNVYAGSTTDFRKNSVEVDPLGILNISAKSIVNRGSFVTNNAKTDLKGDGKNTLQFFTRNIRTEGSTKSNVTIDGNCVVADDLEVNGDNSIVNIEGKYYGYGFDSSDKVNEDDSEEITKLKNDTNTTYEHERRSAIMVNGRNADVDLSNITDLIIGGRAYIDLMNGSFVDSATYMTGESFSFKGNQNVYVIDTSELGNKVLSNPIQYSSIASYVTGDELNYAQLGLSSNDVVAKKVGDSVFFYKKNVNPENQTNYFTNQFNNWLAVRNGIKDQIEKLGLKNLCIGSSTKSYSSGAIMQVKDSKLQQSLIVGENGISKDKFLELVKDMKLRYEFISSELTEFDSYPLGEVSLKTTILPAATTPYDTYVDSVALANNCATTYKVDDVWATYPKIQKILKEIGYSSSDIIKVIISDNKGKASLDITGCPNGLVICSGDVVINGDFNGLIICGGDMKISGNYTSNQNIKANRQLVTAIADHDPMVAKVLNGYSAGMTENENSSNTQTITYKDLVSTDNWKKNEN